MQSILQLLEMLYIDEEIYNFKVEITYMNVNYSALGNKIFLQSYMKYCK